MTDEEYMKIAIEEAEKAASEDEVPVGAIVVFGEDIIAKARNKCERWQDPTAHAEILAIQQAANHLGSWRLSGCKLFVTKEPCPMCAGAIFQARVDKLIYGAPDIKTGAAGTLYNITNDARLNHQTTVTSGVCEEECRKLLQDFFKKRR
ncbi:tRNA adenosine(34) deaminase TadA [Candidatus Oleimmundimicrobium sp.]|uniref:tRNA adenosine(34) deaminase TadA n=1 Tax=Candidatus Oleimmundimicrobium sp. TaxID=3060597 RepID=UPI00271C45BF|nr:tRNA adenosine(34) deaminase TadA [Candidatus Oleimmundimicrobium sp.]MDO8886828.1 tRNA adenosine(34) deaminase TadA [Candidatus Oleimmundimicrobium sp.]